MAEKSRTGESSVKDKFNETLKRMLDTPPDPKKGKEGEKQRKAPKSRPPRPQDSTGDT